MMLRQCQTQADKRRGAYMARTSSHAASVLGQEHCGLSSVDFRFLSSVSNLSLIWRFRVGARPCPSP
eukprot:2581696-Rhodomonas_salina.1